MKNGRITIRAGEARAELTRQLAEKYECDEADIWKAAFDTFTDMVKKQEHEEETQEAKANP